MIVSSDVLSSNGLLNSRRLDSWKSSADSTNFWISWSDASADSADIEQFSIRCDARSSIPLAHHWLACELLDEFWISFEYWGISNSPSPPVPSNL